MPHKRAKKSTRELQRLQTGSDLAPGKQALESEAIPKSVARVLDAVHIREQWKSRKRMPEDDLDAIKPGKRRKTEKGDRGELKTAKISGILPGESLQHFNKRVENDMRPLVKNAVQSSLANARKVRTTEMNAKKKAKAKHAEEAERSPSPPPIPSKHADRPKEFQTISSSAPRRLNDIAQAPPEFTKLPRGAVWPDETRNAGKKRDGVLSMAQKAMMEDERNKAIARYREMKAKRRSDGADGS
ncbi:uncharacterized protein BT62DRAFT_981740 [Guyanagaster necrorhizus]|uniref:Uncharacterized protein n=1 Tax=Guyanagaster necrorhizus TaxID=856835 RepID=A0A9P7VP14_9AGAR|nr:uncharacterized protein BT62DRAFT_981740 [Guyanagaster necrorhizus MCA 3950]KAG7444068.1 hypothetical protein BT62DRAFT_981740 [Guyanagaster necrorhizus MCA 3950]